jgi:hypothetical protein
MSGYKSPDATKAEGGLPIVRTEKRLGCWSVGFDYAIGRNGWRGT